jgi:hypothetical protein
MNIKINFLFVLALIALAVIVSSAKSIDEQDATPNELSIKQGNLL